METIRANAARLAWTKYLNAISWRQMCEHRAPLNVPHAKLAEDDARRCYDRVAAYVGNPLSHLIS